MEKVGETAEAEGGRRGRRVRGAEEVGGAKGQKGGRERRVRKDRRGDEQGRRSWTGRRPKRQKGRKR